jgi:dephospho-CoA kinase
MLKVGITGGIGSGKTLVCSVFQCLGIPIYSSDAAAKIILDTDPTVKKALSGLFGMEVYTETGSLNRKALADIVFRQPESLVKLNQIVHPLVRTHFLNWVEKNNKAPYVIKEAAILIESGAHKDVDVIVAVYAPEKKRIERAVQRDGISAEAVLSRIKRQMPEQEKLELSDYILYNDDRQMLLPQVLKMHNFFCHI